MRYIRIVIVTEMQMLVYTYMEFNLYYESIQFRHVCVSICPITIVLSLYLHIFAIVWILN